MDESGAVDLSKYKVGQHTYEVEPVTYEQVLQAGDDFYIIDKSISEIVKEINDIDNRLHVKYNAKFDFFILYGKEEINGNLEEYLVKTFKTLDKRIVDRVRQITHPSYDIMKEGDEHDSALDREKLYRIDQKLEDYAERLVHAFEKDFGVKNHAFFSEKTTRKLVHSGKDFMGGLKNNAENS